MKFSQQEKQIIEAFRKDVGDKELSKKTGMTVRQIRSKRQNLCAKIGRRTLMQEKYADTVRSIQDISHFNVYNDRSVK